MPKGTEKTNRRKSIQVLRRVKSESEESRKTGKGDSGSRKGMSEKSLHVFVEISSKK